MKTLALLVALVATGTAHAALLCARPRSDGTFSTTVKLREACKGNEVELGIVTLQPLRLFGPTTTSTTSTTLPPCAAGGRRVGGVCWYAAGDEADNCNQVCAGVGLAYDEATRTFAGSDGTLANCVAVVTAFGAFFESPADVNGCTTGSGCSVVPNPDGPFVVQRCVTPATTAGAVGDYALRLCACS